MIYASEMPPQGWAEAGEEYGMGDTEVMDFGQSPTAGYEKRREN